MVAKGGGGQRRDCLSQRGVITASEAAKASRIWTTKMNVAGGGGKQEDWSIFWWWGQLLQ
jgi:hypothetical protein